MGFGWRRVSWLYAIMRERGREQTFRTETVGPIYCFPLHSAPDWTGHASNLAYVTGVITDQLLDTLASINHCREPCTWKEVERADKHLAYIWEHFDQWNHKREGATDGKNSQYALTSRCVILAPTKLYTNSQDVQYKKFVAKWSMSILIYFRANG